MSKQLPRAGVGPDGRTIAERIEDQRKAIGKSQEALAVALGKNPKAGQSQVSKWVSKGIIPEGETLARLPEILQCDGHWLLTGDGTPDKKPAWKLGIIREVLDAKEPSEFRVVRQIPPPE